MKEGKTGAFIHAQTQPYVCAGIAQMAPSGKLNHDEALTCCFQTYISPFTMTVIDCERGNCVGIIVLDFSFEFGLFFCCF